MKLLKRIAKSLFIVSILGLVMAVVYSGVILEITNNSRATIREVSINYGRGTYFLPELKSGETVKNRVGKIGEGANFEIVWKYGESNVGDVTYNVYFTDILSPTRISITFPDEKSALLEYRGKAYKPYVKSGTSQVAQGRSLCSLDSPQAARPLAPALGNVRLEMVSTTEWEGYKKAVAEIFDARTDYNLSESHARLADRLLRLAAPQAGERVLDIATGTGFIAIPAASLVGEYGTVTGVDTHGVIRMGSGLAS